MKRRGKSIIEYVLPPLFTLMIGMLVLMIKGIWPFGSETIDYYDMAQQNLAMYAQVYDELHAGKSIFYDFYIALGRGIYGGTNMSPFNLLLLLTPRDMLLEFMSLFTLLKMAAMSLTMYIWIRKYNKVSYWLVVLESIGYGVCGFVLMNYTISQWLDIAVLVPLVLMFTEELLTKGKMKGFVITLTLCLLNSYYPSFMIAMYIVFMTGLYLWGLRLRERKTHVKEPSPYVIRLALAAIISVLLSAVSWAPDIMQSAGSARVDNESTEGIVDFYLNILTKVLPDYTSRWWALLGLSFAAAIVVIGLVRDIRNKNNTRILFVAGGFAIILSELVLENIHLFWHFGSYVNYPVRNGFLIYCTFAGAVGIYGSEVLGSDAKEQPKRNARVIFPIAMVSALCVLVLAIGIRLYSRHAGMSIYTVFKITVAIMFAGFVIYFFLLVIKSGKYVAAAVPIKITGVIFYCILLLGKPTFVTGYSEEPEQEGEYIRICNSLAGEWDLSESRIDRIKNPDTSLNSNYGLILKRPSLSGWSSLTGQEMLNGARLLGYSGQFTRLLDAGGTVFTDALLHVTDTVSCVAMDEDLYKRDKTATVVVDHRTGETAEYTLYQNRYTLPFGIRIKKDSVSGIANSKNIVSVHNSVFAGTLGEDDDMKPATFVSDYHLPGKEDENIKIDGHKVLYLIGDCVDEEYANTTIRVNGNVIGIPTIHDVDNTLYPSHFNNNVICLGSFTDETVNVKVEQADDEFEIALFTVNLDMLDTYCENQNEYDWNVTAGTHSLSMNVNADEDCVFMMPLAYERGWQVKVNGNEVKAYGINGVFTAIDIPKGDNRIEMVYYPPLMREGLWTGIVTLIILFITSQMLKKKTIIHIEEAGNRILAVACRYGWILAIVAIYIASYAYAAYYYAMRIM